MKPWMIGLRDAAMPFGEIRLNELCPKCFLPSLHRLAYMTLVRNRPHEMGQSVKYCRDCGWADV